MKAAKECCRRTFCARSLIFMASASIIFWNELIKRTKTTADAVVFLLKCGERSNAALAGTLETESSKVGVVLTGSAEGWIIQREGQSPSLLVVRVQGRSRNAPAHSLFSQGAILSRERMALIPCSAYGAASPFGTKKSSLCRENSFSLFFNTALRRRGCGDQPSANGAFLRRFRDARRR